MRHVSLHCALLLVVLMAVAPEDASSELAETFRARLSLDLCPEYRVRTVVLDVFYTLGDSTEIHAPQILSQSVDEETLSATVDMRLPAVYGTTPINVFAFCRDSQYFSDASNVMTVSNCDALSLIDTDGDGIPNSLEDINCDNFFSPGDTSNPDNVDTDGDGVRDLVEILEGFDPTNPGSSPRPLIVTSAPFDPDQDGDSNPVAWRPAEGTWYVKDFPADGSFMSFPFGAPGDVPFFYDSPEMPSDVGVVRNSEGWLLWLFHGSGFRTDSGISLPQIVFGMFGDNLVPGPWERAGQTNPAVARLFDNRWTFFVYTTGGGIRSTVWGGNGDVPKVQDYDGDGVFDVAVFRPSEGMTYVIRSSDHGVGVYEFGTGTADYSFRGDITGDGIDDITFWEPLEGLFYSLTSDNGFDDQAAADQDPEHYFEMQLGLYQVHVPLSFNRRGDKVLLTVVDHQSGFRYTRTDNDPVQSISVEQWGLPGDSLG